MRMSILSNIDESVTKYLNGEIKNPLLKKVIEDDITCSSGLYNVFKTYLSDIVDTANFNDKLDNLSILIKNVSNDTRNILKTVICNSFIELSSDQHMFLIISMNNNIKNIFELLADDPAIIQILKYIVSGLALGVNNDEYVIKCIEVCLLINKNISNAIVEEYININSANLLTNNKLLAFIINYIDKTKFNIITDIFNLIKIKVNTIKEQLDTLSLTNMDFAFEIYKLGQIVIESKIGYNMYVNNLLHLKDEQIEYIVKAIHTCIINNNAEQAQTLLAVIFYLSSENTNVFIKYYNKSLSLRLNNPDITTTEYNLWNINNDYLTIINDSKFLPYVQVINNIKYTHIINSDLEKIRIKNSDIKMKKVKVLLTDNAESNDIFLNIVHHNTIQEYINGVDKYISVRSTLQTIKHNMESSNIKIKTPMGTISCSLIFGSILLHLNDSDMTTSELSSKLKISEDEITKRISSLIKYNIVINLNNKYKYVPPFGDVECKLIDDTIIEPVIIERFSDLELTTESKIMKEVKPNKMNKMELERRVQEFLGASYVRKIFFDRLESLKKRYYVKEVDSIIEYIV